MGTARNAVGKTASRADEALFRAYAENLATRPARALEPYLYDLELLKSLAGDTPLTQLESTSLRRFLAALHARGLSGRSLARILSGWRAFYRYAIDRASTLAEDPCAGLKARR